MLVDTGRRVGLRLATASERRLPGSRGEAVEVGSGVGAFILEQVAREKALGEKNGDLGANLRSHSLLRRISTKAFPDTTTLLRKRCGLRLGALDARISATHKKA
jgi:hypothetical protein